MKHLSPYFSLFLIPLLVNLPVAAQLPDPGASDAAPAPEALQIRVLDNNPGSVAVNSQAAKGLSVQITDSTGAPVADAAVALRLPDDGPTGAFADGSHAAVSYTDRSGHAQLASVKWGDSPGVVAMRLTTVKGTAHAGILVEQIVEQILTAASPGAVAASVPASSVPNPPLPVAQLAAPPPASTAPAPAANHPLLPAAPPLKPEPTVSVTNTATAKASSHSHKKWIIIAAIAAGAGAGLAFAGKGKSSSSAPPASSLSIGSPTVSVGHP